MLYFLSPRKGIPGVQVDIILLVEVRWHVGFLTCTFLLLDEEVLECIEW